MKTGFYFIGCYQRDKDGKEYFGVDLIEGSYEYYGKLYIHRAVDYKRNPQKWKVSHVDSGACILPGLDLASARMLAKKLQPFKIWDLRTFEEVRDACQGENPVYAKEVEQIKSIRHERA